MPRSEHAATPSGLSTPQHGHVPHGNANVWRYMNTWKFEQLLKTRALYFANANQLTDQYEVCVPEAVLAKKRQSLIQQGLKDRQLDDAMAAFHWSNRPEKAHVYINCWSVSPHESYALWKIYLGGDHNGVAIKTSFSQLRQALSAEQSRNIKLTNVAYKGFISPDSLSPETVIATKKPFYDFEKELRLFFVCDTALCAGVNVAVDVERVIHQVFISPFADPEYITAIQQLLKRYHFAHVTIRHSQIREL